MRINIFFYSLVIFYSALFASSKIVPDELSQSIQKQSKEKPKPRFTTSLKSPAFNGTPTNAKKPSSRRNWFKLGKISKNGEKPLISPASSTDSGDTTLSTLTNDSSLSSASENMTRNTVSRRNSSKVVPIESDSLAITSSSTCMEDSLVPTYDNLQTKPTDASLVETEILMSAATMQNNAFLWLEDWHKYVASLDEKGIKRWRGHVNDALKEYYSQLATNRVKLTRLRTNHSKLLLGNNSERLIWQCEDEIDECESDIEDAEKGIERCRLKLAVLPIDDMEEKPRSERRRGAIVLGGY